MTLCPSLPSDSGDPAAASAGAGPTPSARSASVNGHMQTVDPRPAQQLDVARGEVGGVHHRRARAERARRVEHLGRGGAERRPALGVLQRLLGQVRVDRRPVRMRPGHNLGHLVRGDRADRVDRRAEPRVRPHHPQRVAGEPGNPLRPGGGRAVAEPELDARQRQRLSAGQEPAGQVAGVEQGDPQAGCGRGRDQHPAHLVRVAVALSPAAVVQVVELADAGDPGQRHLRVDGAGEREVRPRVEPPGDRVHAVPPGPERVAGRRAGPGGGDPGGPAAVPAAPAPAAPRNARWNACECALARPGRVSPGSRTVPGGISAAGVPGTTAVNRSPCASMSTSSASGTPPPSHAVSACQRRTAAASSDVTRTSFPAGPGGRTRGRTWPAKP